MIVSPGSQKSGRNKEVTVRGGSTVTFHSLNLTALFQKHANVYVQNQLTFAFFAAANYLSGPLGKQNFTYTGSKGHGL